MLGNANGIDLNSASVNQLGRIGGLGPVLAARIVQLRPIRRWADLETIGGFDHELVNNLRGSGAKLGRVSNAKLPKSSKRVSSSSTSVRTGAAARRRAAASKKSGGKTVVGRRRATNIFSSEGR